MRSKRSKTRPRRSLPCRRRGASGKAASPVHPPAATHARQPVYSCVSPSASARLGQSRRSAPNSESWNSYQSCDMQHSGRYAPPWGVETPSSGLASAAATPHSLTYGRGACGVCNRFTRTKGHRGRLERFPTPRSPEVGVGSFAGAHRRHALLRGGGVETIARPESSGLGNAYARSSPRVHRGVPPLGGCPPGDEQPSQQLRGRIGR